MDIPILVVGMEAMNENVKHRPSGAHDPSGAVTGGMGRLRQYFKFCIETDESVVYGQGFRAAARAYAKLGIQELLYYVALNQDFPPM